MSSFWFPAHISGFFEPCLHEDPLRSGSRNCGPCLDVGVTTAVKLKKSKKVLVKLNGRRVRAPTTLRVVCEIAPGVGLEVAHRCEVPVGAGLGASGAGALGAAFATTEILGLPLPQEQLIRIAHRAEVLCRTGLGDVPAQALGGLVFSLEPGAPPYGKWMNIEVPGSIRVVVCVLGELKTSRLLRDEEFLHKCKTAGRKAFRLMSADPNFRTFLRASKDFAESLGLYDRELKTIAQDLENAGAFGASQAMLGRAVFAFVDVKRLGSVKKVASDLVGEDLIVARISKNKPS